MGLLEILRGEKPLFRANTHRHYVKAVEQEFATLLNSKSGHNYQYIPQPSGDTLQAAMIEAATRPQVVSGRYTLDPTRRTLILDTKGDEWDVYITVPGVGVVAYVTHDSYRVLSTSGTLHEGIPLTNNPSVAGRPTPNHLKWRGQMWMSGDTPNMVVDVEAS